MCSWLPTRLTGQILSSFAFGDSPGLVRLNDHNTEFELMQQWICSVRKYSQVLTLVIRVRSEKGSSAKPFDLCILLTTYYPGSQMDCAPTQFDVFHQSFVQCS